MSSARHLRLDPHYIALLAALWVNIALTQDSTLISNPVGFNKTTCLAGSDTVVSIPFHQSPAFSGEIARAEENGSTLIITPQRAPNVFPGSFTAAPHYLRFRDSVSHGGVWYDVLSNDAGTITVETRGASLGLPAPGDSFDVIPHWLLSTLLPSDSQETMHVSTSLRPRERKSRLMFADVTSQGFNLSPNRIFFLTSDGWFEATAGLPSADEVVIRPGRSVIIRHPDGVEDTSLFTSNQVHLHDFRMPLRTNASDSQDNHLGLARPVPVKLSDLDLGPDQFLDSDSNAPADRKDELHIYDNGTTRKNKVPSMIYFRVSGEWRLDNGTNFPVSNDEEVPPSTAIVIRKRASTNGETSDWINSPRY